MSYIGDAVTGAAGYVRKKVGEYRENQKEREFEDEYRERQEKRESGYSPSDYRREGKIRRLNALSEKAEDDGDIEGHLEYSKLASLEEDKQRKRGELIDDRLYANERIRERRERLADEARYQTPGDSHFGAPSDMFGVSGYGGGSGMFSLGTPVHPSNMVGGRRKGRAHVASVAQSNDMFNVGNYGNGSDLFSIGGSAPSSRRKSSSHHSVGHAMAPADLFAPANVFGIGGSQPSSKNGRSMGNPKNPFAPGGVGVAMGNPFIQNAPNKRRKRGRK